MSQGRGVDTMTQDRGVDTVTQERGVDTMTQERGVDTMTQERGMDTVTQDRRVKSMTKKWSSTGSRHQGGDNKGLEDKNVIFFVRPCQASTYLHVVALTVKTN